MLDVATYILPPTSYTLKRRNKMFNAEKIKNECVEWIRDFFEQNGKGCNAVLGISGGKDSSIVAALCVEALGKDRVIGVLMPQGEQKGYFRIIQACKSFRN